VLLKAGPQQKPNATLSGGLVKGGDLVASNVLRSLRDEPGEAGRGRIATLLLAKELSGFDRLARPWLRRSGGPN
jgi:hypothetical protein